MKTSRLTRLALIVVAAAGLTGVALVANQAPPTGAKMTAAANKFLATLSPDEKKEATFAFDDPHRTAWFFTPRQDQQKNPTRKGLRLERMTEAQKAAALDLLRSGLSAKGYEQATTIMTLEAILAELETKGSMVRNPGWYFVSIFGEPSNTGRWGWRVEGHHLSVNFTLDRGEVQSPTPLMFGANPAVVMQGPKEGLRTLPEIELTAKQLIISLTNEQKKEAELPKQLPEIQENTAAPKVGEPVGLPAAKMVASQKAILLKLMEAYANRLPPELAAAELKRATDAGLDRVHFAYHLAEGKKGNPYTYRVQGPTFLIEFLNVQSDSAGNPANHIHSAWRRLPADFGLKQ